MRPALTLYLPPYGLHGGRKAKAPPGFRKLPYRTHTLLTLRDRMELIRTSIEGDVKTHLP